MTAFSKWNYRVIKRLIAGETSHGIYEVYYDESGKPSACTESPVEPFGETVEELMLDLDRMRSAAGQPTLNYDDFSRDK